MVNRNLPNHNNAIREIGLVSIRPTDDATACPPKSLPRFRNS
jgi:hypothetical protein